MSAQPLIGITTYLADDARWGVWALPAALLPAGYHRLVQRSGGLAALLPPGDPGTAAEVVARLDGLVIAGGPDVEPVRYGADPDPRTGPPARDRDIWELALIDAALQARVPLLGICRGMQLLNVALGGTLVQHIDGHAAPRASSPATRSSRNRAPCSAASCPRRSPSRPTITSPSTASATACSRPPTRRTARSKPWNSPTRTTSCCRCSGIRRPGTIRG